MIPVRKNLTFWDLDFFFLSGSINRTRKNKEVMTLMLKEKNEVMIMKAKGFDNSDRGFPCTDG